jgi:hypothetical protein
MTTELRIRIGSALGQDRVRANIRRAMDRLVIKRRNAFLDGRVTQREPRTDRPSGRRF